ncbi:MAG TPA: TonB-dependent receptor, partial [Hanamia sp.]|nr:TonB-dependent receptor [Hanamia sp.]
MNLSIVIVLASCLTVNAKGYSQQVSISMQNAKIQKVFKAIRSQTGYQFLYTNKVLSKSTPVTLSLKDVSIEQALDDCFKGQPFSYTIIEKTIVIKLKKTIELTVENKDEKKLTVVTITISGRVINEKGEPLVGVSVKVKNTQTGTSTDKDGYFELSVPDESSVIEFSYVGYVSQSFTVGSRTRFEVKLSLENKNMQDVVVIGYGTQRKKDLTGSVSSIKSADFNQGEVLSPQQSIQGKVAGVNISQNSGKPGGSNTIRIRGGTSLTGSNDPLYVIDGLPISNSAGVSKANINQYQVNFFDEEPTNPLMTLNPDDIESITILKDASATAIYGSRGANGVIVITTKKGTAGKPKVTVDFSGGTSKVEGKLDVLTANEYRQEVSKLGLPINDKGANTNWQDLIYRTGYSQNYNLAMSGGAGKTVYRASLGYGDQQGVMLASDLKRTEANININHSELNDRLTFDFRVNYGQTFSKQSPISNTIGSEFGSSMNYEALVFNPTFPVFDSAGNYNNAPPYRVNPVSFSTQLFDQITNNRFLGNLSTTLKILDPLSFNVNLAYTNQNIDRNTYVDKANLLGQGLGGYASVQKLQDYSKLLETILRYHQQLGDNSIEALAGYSYQYFVDQGDFTSANGFLSDLFKWYSLQAASTISNVSTFQQSNTLISFYGRVNYNYNEKVLLTGTIRRDGSSRFGSGNQWGLFPSGAIAWRLSQENFFKVKPVSDLKLRVSYGITGNQEIGDLSSISTLGATTTGYVVGGQRITTVLPQQYANPDLKWEQTAQFDAGVDFALFNSRLRGTVDYYIKKTTNLLLNIPVPSPTAVNTQLANVGSVQNKGLEVGLTGTIIDKNKFSWESNFIISFNRNKVLSLSNAQYKGNDIKIAPLQGTVSLGQYAQLIMPGQPVGTFWGLKFTGIKDGLETYSSAKDTIIGSAQPDYTFGFTNNFRYDKWSLNFLFRGSVGGDVFNLTAANLGYLNDLPGKNVLASAVSSGASINQPKTFSSRWIENG